MLLNSRNWFKFAPLIFNSKINIKQNNYEQQCKITIVALVIAMVINITNNYNNGN